jgi:DNA-binding response OmpR family regulator
MTQESRSYRILLVEDDATLASMVVDFLSAHEFDVSIEGRGDTAVHRIKSVRGVGYMLSIEP